MINYEKLNKFQYEAVMHDKGPALLLAGAGTGKTGEFEGKTLLSDS